jgi:hypothetical protein
MRGGSANVGGKAGKNLADGSVDTRQTVAPASTHPSQFECCLHAENYRVVPVSSVRPQLVAEFLLVNDVVNGAIVLFICRLVRA